MPSECIKVVAKKRIIVIMFYIICKNLFSNTP